MFCIILRTFSLQFLDDQWLGWCTVESRSFSLGGSSADVLRAQGFWSWLANKWICCWQSGANRSKHGHRLDIWCNIVPNLHKGTICCDSRTCLQHFICALHRDGGTCVLRRGHWNAARLHVSPWRRGAESSPRVLCWFYDEHDDDHNRSTHKGFNCPRATHLRIRERLALFLYIWIWNIPDPILDHGKDKRKGLCVWARCELKFNNNFIFPLREWLPSTRPLH